MTAVTRDVGAFKAAGGQVLDFAAAARADIGRRAMSCSSGFRAGRERATVERPAAADGPALRRPVGPAPTSGDLHANRCKSRPGPRAAGPSPAAGAAGQRPALRLTPETIDTILSSDYLYYVNGRFFARGGERVRRGNVHHDPGGRGGHDHGGGCLVPLGPRRGSRGRNRAAQRHRHRPNRA